MERQVLEAMQPKAGGLYADGTVVGGGHAFAVLQASAPTGRLMACDRDGAAVEAATARLSEFAGRFEIRRGNFAELADWVEPESCDGLLLDLGVSSAQLDQPERGFSFQEDGPLDMRQDQRQELTAARLLNEAGAEELADIFWRYGNEEQSRRMARAIVRERERKPWSRTGALADLIEKISPRAGRKSHPATKVFQALRMAVNDELGSLERGLVAAMKILRPGGRFALLTFHSVEDRMVRQFGNRLSRDYESPGPVDVPELRVPRPPQARWVSRKAITADEAELKENPRSRSAQLRVMEKLKF